ncbi:MAG TPA: hypothetical protein VLT58_08990 [Polyangia bacterium]|nr:hypothetical protein [Polyangia bacterium]
MTSGSLAVRAVMTISLGLLVGCRPAPPAQSSNTPPLAQIDVSRCVIHAGESHRSSHRVKHAGGEPGEADAGATCWLNAECVQRQGTATAGDGDVSIACGGDSCTCTLQPHAPGAGATAFTFAVPAPCGSAGGLASLLTERCERGTNTGSVVP